MKDKSFMRDYITVLLIMLTVVGLICGLVMFGRYMILPATPAILKGILGGIGFSVLAWAFTLMKRG